jgi:molybdopterin-guanine dinucleotide biosynthesis protein A
VINSYCCFVLAGGKSSRFGSNKSLALFGGQHMVLVVANNLQAAFGSEVRLIGADTQTVLETRLEFYSGPREGDGPLAAIIDAMENTISDYFVFSPNDTPFFTSSGFLALQDRMEATPADVVVAVDDSDEAHAHWLLSIWKKSTCLPVLLSEYERGVRSVHGAVEGLHIERVAFDAASVRNINARTDLPDQGTI